MKKYVRPSYLKNICAQLIFINKTFTNNINNESTKNLLIKKKIKNQINIQTIIEFLHVFLTNNKI
jgi:hypothetical protein